jgi:hypothetical protein
VTEDDLRRLAKGKGLEITSKGVNLAALESAPGTLRPAAALLADAFAPRDGEQLTEEVFQQRVMGLARACGWKVVHIRKVRVQRKDGSVYWETPFAGDGKGFPDLFFAKAGRRAFHAELKVGKNRPDADQLAWKDLLEAAGSLAFLWYPEDWGRIVEMLRT